MYRSRHFLVLSMTFALLFAADVRADVRFIPGTIPTGRGGFTLATIEITGTIERGDYGRVLAMYEKSKQSFAASGFSMPVATALLRLDSNGGDVAEAMAIGARAHATKMTVTIPENARCISACVLILAGGIDRMVFGRVGIHRPHIPLDTAFTEGEQKSNFADIERDVKAYLAYVNVPTALYDKMFRVSPQNVRYLEQSELQDLGLGSADPYFEEASSAQMAKILGISKTEYMARRARADRCLGLTSGKLGKCLSEAYAGK